MATHASVLFHYDGTLRYVSPDTKVHGANMGPIWGQQEFYKFIFELNSFRDLRIEYIPVLFVASAKSSTPLNV